VTVSLVVSDVVRVPGNSVTFHRTSFLLGTPKHNGGYDGLSISLYSAITSSQ